MIVELGLLTLPVSSLMALKLPRFEILIVNDGSRDRTREILHLVQVISRGTENNGRLLVLREGVGEAQRAVDGGCLELPLPYAGRTLERLAIGVDRRVACGRRLLVLVVLVGCPLVLDRGIAEILVLK